MTENCEYCNQPTEGERCTHCGAPAKPSSKKIRGSPFYLDGYFVWPEEDVANLTVEFFVYLGDRLICTVPISYPERTVLIEMYGEGTDCYSRFIEKCIRVAVGTKEYEHIKETNKRNPANLIIIRGENLELVRAREDVRRLLGEIS